MFLMVKTLSIMVEFPVVAGDQQPSAIGFQSGGCDFWQNNPLRTLPESVSHGKQELMTSADTPRFSMVSCYLHRSLGAQLPRWFAPDGIWWILLDFFGQKMMIPPPSTSSLRMNSPILRPLLAPQGWYATSRAFWISKTFQRFRQQQVNS